MSAWQAGMVGLLVLVVIFAPFIDRLFWGDDEVLWTEPAHETGDGILLLPWPEDRVLRVDSLYVGHRPIMVDSIRTIPRWPVSVRDTHNVEG